MPNCHLIDPLVTPFIDGQLPDSDQRLVEDHLSACPPCHSRVTAERAVHELIRARKPTLCAVAAPAAVHRRCAALARGEPPAAAMPSDLALADERPSVFTPPSAINPQSVIRTPPSVIRTPPSVIRNSPSAWRARLAPYALAASLVVIVGGAFLYQATDRSARVLAAELTADHWKCFALNRALGTHDTTAAVESSMSSGFGWPVHLPDNPAAAGMELVGSRPCLYGE